MLLGILLSLLIIVCICLIAVILMQRSEGGALGMGGGGGFMTARGASDLLTRTTQWLGAIFFILCLAITVVTGRTQSGGSVVDTAPVGKIDPNLLQKRAPAQPAPGSDFQAPTPSIGGPIAPAPAPNAPPPPDAKTQPANPFENLSPTQ